MGWGKIIFLMCGAPFARAAPQCPKIFTVFQSNNFSLNELTPALKPSWLRFERISRVLTSDPERTQQVRSQLFHLEKLDPVSVAAREQKIRRYLDGLEQGVEAHEQSWARPLGQTRLNQIKNRCALRGEHAY